MIDEVTKGTFVLRDAADSNSYVEAHDLENGDTLFIQYVENVMVSKYIVEHDKTSIDATYITDDSIQKETIQVPQKTNVDGDITTTDMSIDLLCDKYTIRFDKPKQVLKDGFSQSELSTYEDS